MISVGYKRDMIISAFGSTFEGIPITFVQESEPLGTGGAVLKSTRALRDEAPFVLLNGDTSFEVDLKKLENIVTSNQAEIGLALFRSNEESRYSLIKINGSIVEPIERAQKARIGELAHGGVTILKSPSIMQQFKLKQKKFSFEDDFLVALSLKGATLTGAVFTEPFIDIGVPQITSLFVTNQNQSTRSYKNF